LGVGIFIDSHASSVAFQVGQNPSDRDYTEQAGL
jgi:hypothetical protein